MKVTGKVYERRKTRIKKYPHLTSVGSVRFQVYSGIVRGHHCREMSNRSRKYPCSRIFKVSEQAEAKFFFKLQIKMEYSEILKNRRQGHLLGCWLITIVIVLCENVPSRRFDILNRENQTSRKQKERNF